jgi:uncharacterized membrane protein YccC
MIRTETTHSDASLHAAANARWDDEGGASTSARYKTNVKAVQDARSKRAAEMLAAPKGRLRLPRVRNVIRRDHEYQRSS